MEPKKSHQERSARTRQLLLESAATVLDRDGLHELTIDSVLAECGMTRGALYFHFASKQLLLDAVDIEASERVARTLNDGTEHWHHALRDDAVVRASLKRCVAEERPVACMRPVLASGVAWHLVAQRITELVIIRPSC